MKLYILGKNTEDKGNQLEILTKDILTEQGYINITKSLIGVGGEEIDIYAEKEEIIGLRKVNHIVICECKAHEKIINLTDYNKFKGKLATKKEKNKNTIGLLIALSGASGTVVGANQENQSDIQLIANDDISKLLSHIYSLKDIYDIRQYVKSLTNRTIVDISIAYYEYAIYWIISFTGGEYYIIKNHIEENSHINISFICSLIENITSLRTFVDLEQERKAFIRETYYRSTMLMHLMKSPCIKDGLLKEINNSRNQAYAPLLVEELYKIINKCPFVICNNDEITLLPNNDINYVDFYRYILVGSVNVSILSQSYYIKHINKQLLDSIIQIQHNIHIPDEKIEDIILLLQYSPSALAYAIHEDESITRFRGEDGTSLDEHINHIHSQIFIDKVMDYFDYDYCNNSDLHDYYYNTCKINNVIKKKEITINYDDNRTTHLSQEQDIMLCELKEYNTIVATRKLPE